MGTVDGPGQKLKSNSDETAVLAQGAGGEENGLRAHGGIGWDRLKKASRGPSWPHPTGPGTMMDAQGASRAGRRRRYAEEVGVGRAALTFFTACWKWKSPASFRSSQIMGIRGTASMADRARRPPDRSPQLLQRLAQPCVLPRPSEPEGTRHAGMKNARTALWEMKFPPCPRSLAYLRSSVSAERANRQPEAKGFLGVVVFLA